MKQRLLSILILLLLCLGASAADVVSLAGTVVDAQTGETLPFVQVYFVYNGTDKPTSVGTTTDLDGLFSLQNQSGYTTVYFQMIGYKPHKMTLLRGQNRKNVRIKLEPDVYALQDVVVKPTGKYKQRYRRKDNPAVELIKNVIAHKDSATMKTAPQYTADTYSRMSFALENFHPDFQKSFWKSFAFAEKYIDTVGEYDHLTVSIRENLANEYFQRKPRREKKIQTKYRVFGLEDQIDGSTFRKNVNDIFRDVDINNDNMNVLFNRFVSPLSSSLAVSYYQYYIMDTLLVEGDSCIDLAFVPVNSESYSFTGHLYIMNDGSYKLKKYAINVPPNINLNFVSDYSVEHQYKRLDNGIWVPDRTNTCAKFYVFNKKHNLLARQTKIYTKWDFESEIDKQVFSAMTAEEVEPEVLDSNSVRLSDKYWETLRPEPLSFYEASVYDLVQEFLSAPKFRSLVQLVNAMGCEFISTAPASHMWDSKFDIGPIYNFYSWNPLEGSRFRIGGQTTGNVNQHLFFLGYVAFGVRDLRPKYNATLLYSFNEKKYQPYEKLRNNLSLSVQYDVEEPGQQIGAVDRDNIFMSIPLSKPTMKNYQYVFHAKLDYLKEWQNKLTLHTYFDYSHNEPAGVLRYDRVVGYNSLGEVRMTQSVKGYHNYEGLLELRYSPGAFASIDRRGYESMFTLENDAPLIRLTHYMGYLDDRSSGGLGFYYNKTELTAESRFWFSSFGHLDARIQAGMIWNKVPFTKLYFPAASTSIFLALNGFNQMQPMEFLMDKYVALYATYYFKGWILNRIPGLNKLKLRGVVSFSGIYGGLSAKNNPYSPDGAVGLYLFPNAAKYNEQGEYVSGYTSSPIGKLPYMELTVGLENILKFIRIDYVRRLTYNEYTLPDGHTRTIGKWGRNGVKISVRFAL